MEARDSRTPVFVGGLVWRRRRRGLWPFPSLELLLFANPALNPPDGKDSWRVTMAGAGAQLETTLPAADYSGQEEEEEEQYLISKSNGAPRTHRYTRSSSPSPQAPAAAISGVEEDLAQRVAAVGIILVKHVATAAVKDGAEAAQQVWVLFRNPSGWSVWRATSSAPAASSCRLGFAPAEMKVPVPVRSKTFKKSRGLNAASLYRCSLQRFSSG